MSATATPIIEPVSLWRAQWRTFWYKRALSAFGMMRTVQAKLTRRRAKKWHGPAWKKIGGTIFGSAARPSIYMAKYLMYVRPHQINDLIALFGRPEEQFVDQMFLNLKPGDIVVDAGAYIGQYTKLAGEQVGETGKVLAIEPDADNFTMLQRNVREDQMPNVRLLNIAIGGQDGEAVLTSVSDDSALCTLKANWIDELYPGADLAKTAVKVPVRTLPSLMEEHGLDHIDLLKVDVEGAEIQVFEGAAECLRSGKVHRVICELHGTRQQVKPMLEELGFEVEMKRQHAVAYHKTISEAGR